MLAVQHGPRIAQRRGAFTHIEAVYGGSQPLALDTKAISEKQKSETNAVGCLRQASGIDEVE